MATITFLYRSKKLKSSLILRYFYIENNKNKFIEVKTQIEVSKFFWESFKADKLDKSSATQIQKNNLVQSMLKIEQSILEREEQNPPTKQNLEHIIYGTNRFQKESITILAIFNKYIEYKKLNLKKNTIKRYIFVRNLIEQFQNVNHKTILIANLDHSFKNHFVSFLVENGYAFSTITRNLKALKTICNFGETLGYEVNESYKNWKTIFNSTLNKNKPIYLSFNEISIIEKVALQKNIEIEARDWLIISCYTGQRFSDFIRFNNEMVFESQHKYFIEFTQIKTSKRMVIPLHNKVLEIIKRRQMNFPKKMSMKYYNTLIKKICKQGDLNQKTYGSLRCKSSHKHISNFYFKWELVSSHIGRRSFATNFFGIIPTSLLKSATGHSTEKMLLEYIGKTELHQAKEIHTYFK